MSYLSSRLLLNLWCFKTNILLLSLWLHLQITWDKVDLILHLHWVSQTVEICEISPKFSNQIIPPLKLVGMLSFQG